MEEQNFVSNFNILQRFEWVYPLYKYSFITTQNGKVPAQLLLKINHNLG